MSKSTGPGRLPPTSVLAAASDLDGTLVRSDGTLSPATWTVLESLRKAGVPLVVATARTPRAIQRIIGHDRLGIVVCANGAVLWDAGSDRVIAQQCFDTAALSVALRLLHVELPSAGFALLTARRMFIDETYCRLRRNRADAEVVTDHAKVVAAGGIVAIAVRHPNLTAAQVVDQTSHAFSKVGMVALASVPTLDICPVGVNKGTAVGELLATLGCPPEATVAFGDMPNDLPLFEWAGWACAVANAHPSVLKAADEIVPSNDSDGVAVTLRRMLSL